jgi:hypothetical protein
MTDPLFRLLADLPQAAPDPDRAARIRSRCHAVLARGRRSPRRKSVQLTDAFLAGLGAAYLIEAARLALLFSGIG